MCLAPRCVYSSASMEPTSVQETRLYSLSVCDKAIRERRRMVELQQGNNNACAFLDADALPFLPYSLRHAGIQRILSAQETADGCLSVCLSA
jgi:hypothetical protein